MNISSKSTNVEISSKEKEKFPHAPMKSINFMEENSSNTFVIQNSAAFCQELLNEEIGFIQEGPMTRGKLASLQFQNVKGDLQLLNSLTSREAKSDFGYTEDINKNEIHSMTPQISNHLTPIVSEIDYSGEANKAYYEMSPTSDMIGNASLESFESEEPLRFPVDENGLQYGFLGDENEGQSERHLIAPLMEIVSPNSNLLSKARMEISVRHENSFQSGFLGEDCELQSEFLVDDIETHSDGFLGNGNDCLGVISEAPPEIHSTSRNKSKDETYPSDNESNPDSLLLNSPVIGINLLPQIQSEKNMVHEYSYQSGLLREEPELQFGIFRGGDECHSDGYLDNGNVITEAHPEKLSRDQCESNCEESPTDRIESSPVSSISPVNGIVNPNSNLLPQVQSHSDGFLSNRNELLGETTKSHAEMHSRHEIESKDETSARDQSEFHPVFEPPISPVKGFMSLNSTLLPQVQPEKNMDEYSHQSGLIREEYELQFGILRGREECHSDGFLDNGNVISEAHPEESRNQCESNHEESLTDGIESDPVFAISPVNGIVSPNSNLLPQVQSHPDGFLSNRNEFLCETMKAHTAIHSSDVNEFIDQNNLRDGSEFHPVCQPPNSPVKSNMSPNSNLLAQVQSKMTVFYTGNSENIVYGGRPQQDLWSTQELSTYFFLSDKEVKPMIFRLSSLVQTTVGETFRELLIRWNDECSFDDPVITYKGCMIENMDLKIGEYSKKSTFIICERRNIATYKNHGGKPWSCTFCDDASYYERQDFLNHQNSRNKKKHKLLFKVQLKKHNSFGRILDRHSVPWGHPKVEEKQRRVTSNKEAVTGPIPKSIQDQSRSSCRRESRSNEEELTASSRTGNFHTIFKSI